ncbi:hypothetical protein PA598K_04002 [Paenibacillus sp. 598K]|uniref:hypothetical protein n=1 Tax=Paenibacillus sp. 598K TaxID=1117987 RepID=UPI000FF9FA72|nr:hypothetical protein [Paenibacillus sp. 598K]GBF75584.1 hypothetical protein PA598K_04002 [Paenibacillus sp. 598K]
MKTNTVVLKMEAYNELWINCYGNNLLGILRAQGFNESDALVLMDMDFFCSTPDAVVPDNEVHTYYESGGGLLCARANISRLRKLFSREVIEGNNIDLHEVIQQRIKDGNYIFVSVDTSYFPHDVRPKKHPTCIYGFNLDAKVYYVVDDLSRVGILSKHEIPFSFFEKAYYAIENRKISSFGLCVDHLLTSEEYVKNIADGLHIAINGYDEGDYWRLTYGLKSILTAANRLEEVLPKIHSKLIFEQYWNITYPFKAPLVLEERNIFLLTNLLEKGVLQHADYQQLRVGFEESKNSIEKYRKKVMKHIYTDSLKSLKDSDFDFLRGKLLHVFSIDQQMSRGLIGLIT